MRSQAPPGQGIGSGSLHGVFSPAPAKVDGVLVVAGSDVSSASMQRARSARRQRRMASRASRSSSNPAMMAEIRAIDACFTVGPATPPETSPPPPPLAISGSISPRASNAMS